MGGGAKHPLIFTGSAKPREERHHVLVRAKMLGAGQAADVCIRDISRRGALVISNSPPGMGAYVELRASGQAIVGRVVWSSSRRFGVLAQDAIDVLSFVRGIRSPAPLTICSETSARDRKRPSPRHDDPRHAGRGMEFKALALAAAAAGLAIFNATYQELSQPLSIISRQLN